MSQKLSQNIIKEQNSPFRCHSRFEIFQIENNNSVLWRGTERRAARIIWSNKTGRVVGSYREFLTTQITAEAPASRVGALMP